MSFIPRCRAIPSCGIKKDGKNHAIESRSSRAQPPQPTANRQPPTANRQLPTANCQLPTAKSQPPKANRQKKTMRNFRKFEIWQRAIAFTKNIYIVTNGFPDHEKFGLTSQVRRASVSIASNIAEGASRRTDIDFSRFLQIAIGSCFEVETQIVLAKEIGYIDNKQYEKFIDELTIMQKQINLFITRLK